MARKPAPMKAKEPESSRKASSEAGPVRYSAFVASTDPRVTTCEAWKTLMQLRDELLNNPRQDSGTEGWWSKWVGTMQRWLYGGGDWGEGYYEPSHRDVNPDCAVCLDTVKRRRHGMFTPDASYEACASDDKRTMLFPANATFLHNGFVIDWESPFPPISHRGPLVEWVESWIDRIQYIESTSGCRREPHSPPAPTASVPPVALALPEQFAELAMAFTRVQEHHRSDEDANNHLGILGTRGGRLYCAAGAAGISGFHDLSPRAEAWKPPFNKWSPLHDMQLGEMFQEVWINVLTVTARTHPDALPGSYGVGGAVFECGPIDEDGPAAGVYRFPPERWRQYAEASAALAIHLSKLAAVDVPPARAPKPTVSMTSERLVRVVDQWERALCGVASNLRDGRITDDGAELLFAAALDALRAIHSLLLANDQQAAARIAEALRGDELLEAQHALRERGLDSERWARCIYDPTVSSVADAIALMESAHHGLNSRSVDGPAGGGDNSDKKPDAPVGADAIDEADLAILAFLNRNPSLRRKVSDVLPETGPGDRKAIAKRLRKLADRPTPLVEYPRGQHGKVAILPAGIEHVRRATASTPR
jgi:hypothetical protein